MFADIVMSVFGWVLFIVAAAVLMRGATAFGRFPAETSPFIGCGCFFVIIALVAVFLPIIK